MERRAFIRRVFRFIPGLALAAVAGGCSPKISVPAGLAGAGGAGQLSGGDGSSGQPPVIVVFVPNGAELTITSAAGRSMTVAEATQAAFGQAAQMEKTNLGTYITSIGLDSDKNGLVFGLNGANPVLSRAGYSASSVSVGPGQKIVWQVVTVQ